MEYSILVLFHPLILTIDPNFLGHPSGENPFPWAHGTIVFCKIPIKIHQTWVNIPQYVDTYQLVTNFYGWWGPEPIFAARTTCYDVTFDT